jgi:uncharacterized protein (UPF0333 family)
MAEGTSLEVVLELPLPLVLLLVAVMVMTPAARSSANISPKSSSVTAGATATFFPNVFSCFSILRCHQSICRKE